MATIRDKLASYTPTEPYAKRKLVSVKEKGKNYKMSFSPERLCAVFQVDGDIIKDKQKCDKLILFSRDEFSEWDEMFVELKGKDISHAIEQLASTLKREIFQDESVKSKHARIVGSSIPRSTGNSILDRAKIKFIKEFRCDLRAVSPGVVERF